MGRNRNRLLRRPVEAWFASSRALSDRQGRAARSTTALILALTGGIAALALGMAVAAVAGDPHGESAITCTNPASGASWQIRIDYDRSTVDSNPAKIGDTKISWHDAADGGNYTLDRKSGNLTVIVASSTGGYFLYDRCRPEN
jgi:hypothetical protein